jgi:GT2 family glycosyltransferase
MPSVVSRGARRVGGALAVGLRKLVPWWGKLLLRPLQYETVAFWHRHIYPGFSRRIRRFDPATMPEVSILLITYNRERMLREGLGSLLEKTKGDNWEVIVWNNGSTDGTKEYLDSLVPAYPQLRPIHHPKNVGLNAVALSVQKARGFYLVELDDDVVRFPDDWLPQMLRAFKHVPQFGYLAANVIQDEFTTGEKDKPECYEIKDYGEGVVAEHGPTWGWCTMTSLEVIKRVGNFPRRRGRLFFCEDLDYVLRCLRAGYTPAILRDVVVYHASGAVKNDEYGYLELCMKKYEETPYVTRKLEVAQRYADEHAAAKG